MQASSGLRRIMRIVISLGRVEMCLTEQPAALSSALLCLFFFCLVSWLA